MSKKIAIISLVLGIISLASGGYLFLPILAFQQHTTAGARPELIISAFLLLFVGLVLIVIAIIFFVRAKRAD